MSTQQQQQPHPDVVELAAAVIRALERIQRSRYSGATERDATYALGRVLGILEGLTRADGLLTVADVVKRLDAVTVTHHDPEDDPEDEVSG